MADKQLDVFLEFSGGAELLFDKVKEHELKLPVESDCKCMGCLIGATDGAASMMFRITLFSGAEFKRTLGKLLIWIKDNLLKERPELFIQGDTVRPGILVLVNDTDWELLGELKYELKENDRIIFISTLHGG